MAPVRYYRVKVWTGDWTRVLVPEQATPLGRLTERVETGVVFDLAGPMTGKRVLDVATGDGTSRRSLSSSRRPRA